ncbi:MAG TPA: hypothetical protein VJ397_05725 [Thermoplasmata archaeon]|nr:hypothetical protein [Thermoplasmata archaeon]
MPRPRKPTDLDVSEPTKEWMKTHTKRDVRELATELAQHGEDVSDIVKAIDDLEEVEVEEEEWERTHVVEDEE